MNRVFGIYRRSLFSQWESRQGYQVKQRTKKTTFPSSPLLRGLSVLRSFNETNDALSVTDLAKMTGIPQPTVWRFCRSLESAGYLVTDSGKTLFRPGLALL